MSNRPLAEFRSGISGGVKLTAWQGDRGVSWKLQKSYKDKESGEWKESKYLTDWDLDAIAHCALQAKAWLSERRRAEKNGEPLPASDARAAAAAAEDVTIEDDDIPF